jgi:IMP dehydrogenase
VKNLFPFGRDSGVGLSFDDVNLIPRESTLTSRLDADLKMKSRLLELDVPVFSSPMDSVTEYEMIRAMADAGGLGIVHRYMPLELRFEHVSQSGWQGGVAIGLQDDLDQIERLLSEHSLVNMLMVDVANGHATPVLKYLESLANKFGSMVSIGAGNVATFDGTWALCSAGADFIRVNIGSGSICSTRLVTGVGVPSITAIMWAREALDRRKTKTKLIADGGIRRAGDAAKALAAGADAVMLGSMLAGTVETPGEPIKLQDGRQGKVYRGMASRASQTSQHRQMKPGTAPEGVSAIVPLKGTVKSVIDELAGGLKSSFSYMNARNIDEFHENAQFIRVTSAGVKEASTHIDELKAE